MYSLQPFKLLSLAAVLLALLALNTAYPRMAYAADPQLTVAAASDLKFALEEIAVAFEHQSGKKPRLIFGSSGQFYTQIMQGAPFHLYLSADEVYVTKLHVAGKTVDQGKLYGMGRIGIFVPHRSPVKADPNLDDLAKALIDGRLNKFAIANPEHAPYGDRAMQALQHKGIWGQIKSKLVYGENITQAAQFAQSGSTQGGIIALSLAKAPAFAQQGQFALIPEGWHTPLAQRMVLIKNAPSDAHLFYTYLGTEPAQVIFKKYGFELPRS
ncbi:MAG: molybdate ABC transporter substrate-binding protein [Limnobacter sp.]|nr:molybdate ABC transporter substrate-binding protein [Limnobacter sp.]